MNPRTQFESKVAERYRAKGYDVIIEPVKEDIPFDLGSYRPDLIARKPKDKNYIIEVKHSLKNTPIDHLREVSETVSQNPGWHFLLVTGDDVEPSGSDADEGGLLTKEQILQKRDHAQKLLEQRESAGAFLYLWVVLEAMLRRHAQTVFIPVENLQGTSLVNHLYSQGELSIEQYDTIKELQSLRNRLVHGYQTPDLLPPTEKMMRLVGELFEQFNE